MFEIFNEEEKEDLLESVSGDQMPTPNDIKLTYNDVIDKMVKIFDIECDRVELLLHRIMYSIALKMLILEKKPKEYERLIIKDLSYEFILKHFGKGEITKESHFGSSMNPDEDLGFGISIHDGFDFTQEALALGPYSLIEDMESVQKLHKFFSEVSKVIDNPNKRVTEDFTTEKEEDSGRD